MNAATSEDACSNERPGFDPGQLVKRHQTGVWRYLRALGCEPHLADDLTQETFLAVLQRPFQDFDDQATAAYLRRTAHNLLMTHYRRSGLVTMADNIEELDRRWTRWTRGDDGRLLVDTLRDCLDQLTDRARGALEMRFRDRASRAVIAANLGISEHGAKNLMQRAKRRLRECIEGKLS